MDGRRDPARIAQVIRDLHADIIGLQEVDSCSNGVRDSHQLDYLANATGFRAVAGPTLQRKDGHFGNALLTNYSIVAVRHLDLSVPGREPRGALVVDLDVAGETIRVIVTHFGLRAAERRYQARCLLTTLAQESVRLLVVLGDINEWSPAGRPSRWLETYLGSVPTLRTFPAVFPLFPLDRIWTKPRDAFVNVRVTNTQLTRIASDHLPIMAAINGRGDSNIQLECPRYGVSEKERTVRSGGLWSIGV